jgi:hypothetical protein
MALDCHGRPDLLDGRSKLLKAFQRTLAILAGGKVVDNGVAFGDGSNHCKAVADGLIAGYKDGPFDAQCWRNLQTLGVVH